MSFIPPIIVSEFGELYVFNTVQKTESYVEIYDIDDYEVFDCRGKKLKFVSTKIRRQIWGKEREVLGVKIVEPDIEVFESERLKSIIVDYLKRKKISNRKPFIQKDWDTLILENLITELVNIALVDD